MSTIMSSYCQKHDTASHERMLLARRILQNGLANGVRVSIMSQEGKKPIHIKTRPVSASSSQLRARPGSASSALDNRRCSFGYTHFNNNTNGNEVNIPGFEVHGNKLNFEDISCLADCSTLSEISLDGNPISQDPMYKKNVIRHMQQIRQLDMKRITDDERRLAHVMAKKEEEKKRETNKLQMMKERRQVAINNAKKQWEVMQGSLMTRTNKVIKNMPDLYANHVGNIPNTEILGEGDDTGSSRSSSRMSRPPSAKSLQMEGPTDRVVLSQTQSRANSARSRAAPTPERLPQGSIVSSTTSINVDYLSELEGDTLSLYGIGSLDAFDKNWGIQAAGAVNTIIFKFIEFDEIVKHLHKIRVRFPNVHTLFFNSTNICTLPQLNALSAVRRLDHLTIALDGNPITKFTLWKTYILFRLAHFSLKTINDKEALLLMDMIKCLNRRDTETTN